LLLSDLSANHRPNGYEGRSNHIQKKTRQT
jgi:hypothetical protein